MNTQLIFFLVLVVLYFIHGICMKAYFKKKYKKDDYFMGNKAPDDIQRFFGNAVHSLMVYYFLVLIALIIHSDLWGLISRLRILDYPRIHMLGFISGLLSLVLMTMVRLNLGSSWRVGLDYQSKDELVKSGFYKRIRNPYYTFLLMFQLSLLLVVPSTILVLGFIQGVLFSNLQVRQEENFLKEKYNKEYVDYKNQTGRFFPKIKTL